MKQINNNIKESYCSFEVSDLLKKADFHVPVRTYSNIHDKHKLIHEGFDSEYWGDNRIKDWNADIIGIKPFTGFMSRPTHVIAIEWICVNFGIWIYASSKDDFSEWVWRIDFDNWDMYKNKATSELAFYPTPQDATEAALKYVLENLIKS